MQPQATVLAVNRSAVRLYARGSRFIQKNALLSKALPTAFGFGFGDVLTQYFHRKSDPYKHDATKTAMMAGVGATVAAPVGLLLYRAMDAAWPGTGLLLATGKFTLDQVVGCILWQLAYLSISEPYRQAACELLSRHNVVLPAPRPLQAQLA
jgi:hypothetical protein